MVSFGQIRTRLYCWPFSKPSVWCLTCFCDLLKATEQRHLRYNALSKDSTTWTRMWVKSKLFSPTVFTFTAELCQFWLVILAYLWFVYAIYCWCWKQNHYHLRVVEIPKTIPLLLMTVELKSNTHFLTPKRFFLLGFFLLGSLRTPFSSLFDHNKMPAAQ